jgi:hypothetical protein
MNIPLVETLFDVFNLFAKSTAQKNGYVIMLPREAQHRKMVM